MNTDGFRRSANVEDDRGAPSALAVQELERERQALNKMFQALEIQRLELTDPPAQASGDVVLCWAALIPLMWIIQRRNKVGGVDGEHRAMPVLREQKS